MNKNNTNKIMIYGMAAFLAAFLLVGCDESPAPAPSTSARPPNNDGTADVAKPMPTLIVAVSPEVSPEVVAALRAQAKNLVATLFRSPAGTRVEFWDALDPQPKALLAAGDGPDRVRAGRLAVGVNQLNDFLDACGKGRGEGRLDFPSLCQSLAQRKLEPAVQVVVVGGPLHLVTGADEYFSMANGQTPSDGLFFRRPQDSVYSIREREHALNGVTFHWAFLDRGAFVDDNFRQRVTDVWAKYIALQGGQLADFQPSVTEAFDRVLAASAGGIVTPKADPTAPAVMMRFTKEIREIKPDGKKADAPNGRQRGRTRGSGAGAGRGMTSHEAQYRADPQVSAR